MQATMRRKVVELGGHRLRYSVMGQGPAVVVPRKDRGRYVAVAALATRYRVLQIEPIGFGESDRPVPYPPISVPEQILAGCDAEGVEEFAVWGYSQGGAMACALAQASPRVGAVICGGFNALRPPTAAWIARMNREKRVAVGSRAFWNYFLGFDWHHELSRLEVPILMYAGTRDRQRPSLRDQRVLRALGIDVVDLEGHDHAECGLDRPASPATDVVTSWLQTTAGDAALRDDSQSAGGTGAAVNDAW